MPRVARKMSSSRIFHIILRGINKQIIFEDSEDMQRFLETIARYKGVCECEIYGYCLMDNHIHLLIRVREKPVSDFVKRISSSYVYWFNHKYSRCGHLFQDRYKSEAVEDQRYFLTALRYIHQNPVKAGIVKKVADYRWSSHNEYVSGSQFADVDFALKIFSENKNNSIELYTKFTNAINDDKCLDYELKYLMKDEDLRKCFYKLGVEDITALAAMEKTRRNEIIKKIKALDGVSFRQISRLTGIPRGTIDRI